MLQLRRVSQERQRCDAAGLVDLEKAQVRQARQQQAQLIVRQRSHMPAAMLRRSSTSSVHWLSAASALAAETGNSSGSANVRERLDRRGSAVRKSRLPQTTLRSCSEVSVGTRGSSFMSSCVVSSSKTSCVTWRPSTGVPGCSSRWSRAPVCPLLRVKLQRRHGSHGPTLVPRAAHA
jgi:hypothetical protein